MMATNFIAVRKKEIEWVLSPCESPVWWKVYQQPVPDSQWTLSVTKDKPETMDPKFVKNLSKDYTDLKMT